MFCKRKVTVLSVLWILCSPALSIAQTTATRIEGFPAPTFAQRNADAQPRQNQKIDMSFPLIFKRRAQLETLLQQQQDPASANFQCWLTPEEVGQRFGADDKDLWVVVRYAQSQGFTVTKVWPNRLFVSVSGSVAQVEKAFHIRLLGYNRPQNMRQEGDPPTFFAPDRQPTLPADIASRITAIHGLTNILVPRHGLRGIGRARNANEAPPQSSSHQTPGQQVTNSQFPSPEPSFSAPLTPAQVSKVYNVDGLHTLGNHGEGMHIGIMSPTQFYVSDVQTFTQTYGITGYTLNETWVQADGRASLPTSSNGADAEAALDCEIILGQANRAAVTLYETVWDSSAHVLDAWNQAGAEHAPVITCSWGISERQLSQGFGSFATDFDNVLATMAAAGQSIFVATGDFGAADTNGLDTSFPSTSPHVTAIGGASLPNDNNGAWASETGWSNSTGGLSILMTAPSWQTTRTGPGVKNSYSSGFRQVPDVAALADNTTPGYSIYASHYGGLIPVGGTSASTPLWASAVLLMDENAKLGSRGIGNFAPYVYALNATSVNPAFHDITSGSNATNNSNGKYPCTVGWDFVTGWGSADFTRLNAALSTKGAVVAVSSVTLNPTRIIGGNMAMGTITLTGVAPSGGLKVTLFSNNAAATVSPFVLVPQGKTSVTFTITTISVETPKQVAIYATAGDRVKAILTVAPVPITVTNMVLNPSMVQGGKGANGTVLISRPAPAGGLKITLSRTNGAVVVMHAVVVIAAGQNSASFPIVTTRVRATTSSTVTASLNGSSVTATLTVTP